MRFGAMLVPKVAWTELAQRAVSAEEAGFDAVWIDDHIQHPADPTSPWLEAWTALTGLAGVTSRVTIGPLVSNIVLRHPAVLVRQALTVDELSGGRLDLGIGAGYAPSDHAALGEEPWPPGERFRRFAAAVDDVRRGIGARPLTVAAHEPRSLDVAARVADTWVSFGGFDLSPDAVFRVTRERLERVRASRPVRARLLAGSAALTKEPIWQSVDAFDAYVGRYEELGIDELAFHWPPAASNPAVDERVVEQIVARF